MGQLHWLATNQNRAGKCRGRKKEAEFFLKYFLGMTADVIPGVIKLCADEDD
jgi:hypothetical protein